MSEFKEGDRVTWHFSEQGQRYGRVTSVNNDRVYVTEDGSERIGCVSRSLLLHIEEPQPWQGECAYYRCTRPLRAGHAHIYHDADYGTAATHGCAWYCENHFDVLTLGSRPPTREEQPLALVASREWMAGRYPDEAKWQETT